MVGLTKEQVLKLPKLSHQLDRETFDVYDEADRPYFDDELCWHDVYLNLNGDVYKVNVTTAFEDQTIIDANHHTGAVKECHCCRQFYQIQHDDLFHGKPVKMYPFTVAKHCSVHVDYKE